METEGRIGFFVNTLVLRSELSGKPTLKEFLQRVREMVLEAYANQDIPFEKLVEELAPERSRKQNPLVQAVFILQNTPQGTLEWPGLTLSPASVATRTTKFDLTLNVVEAGDGITATWDYNNWTCSTRGPCNGCPHIFTTCSQAICAAPETQLQELPLLSTEESRHLLFDFNATQADFPVDKSLPQLFEEQVARTPELIAGSTFESEPIDSRATERARQPARTHAPGVKVSLPIESSPSAPNARLRW